MNVTLKEEGSRAPECRPSAACAYCARLTGVLTDLANVIRRDEEHAVPEDVVDAALALFSLPAPCEAGSDTSPDEGGDSQTVSFVLPGVPTLYPR